MSGYVDVLDNGIHFVLGTVGVVSTVGRLLRMHVRVFIARIFNRHLHFVTFRNYIHISTYEMHNVDKIHTPACIHEHTNSINKHFQHMHDRGPA